MSTTTPAVTTPTVTGPPRAPFLDTDLAAGLAAAAGKRARQVHDGTTL